MKKYQFKVELLTGNSIQTFNTLEECKKVYDYYTNNNCVSISKIYCINKNN